MILLSARDAGRDFGGVTALSDVTLDVAAGEVLGLAGPNGGGKSTLLLLFAGLLRPSRGRVTVGGVPACELALAHTGHVGLITAHAGLYPLLTGRENLHYFGGLHGIGPSDVDARAAPVLGELGVADALDRPSGTYSSGTRQKISLVRALLMSPRALLLDEPTSNLDPAAAAAIHGAVRGQAEGGVAVVIATHDLHAAEHLCDRVAFVRQTIRHVETLDGPRGAPPEGRLLARFREFA